MAVIVQMGKPSPRVSEHGSKLVKHEWAAMRIMPPTVAALWLSGRVVPASITSDPLLPEQHRAGRVELYQHRDHEHQRPQHREPESRYGDANDVSDSLSTRIGRHRVTQLMGSPGNRRFSD